MKVSLADAIDEWDELIRTKEGSPFHCSGFLEPLKNELNDPIYIVFKEKDQIIGWIAGIEVRSNNAIFKKSGLFKTALFYSGPRFDEALDALIGFKELERFLVKKGISRYQIMDMDHSSIIPDMGEGYQKWDQTEYLIHLDGEWESIFSRVRKSFRKDYRRGARLGLETSEEYEPSYVDELMRLQENTAIHREHRGYDSFNFSPIPNITPSSMKRILVEGNGRIFVTRLGEQIMSIEYFIATERSAYALFMGTTDEGYKSYANKFTDIEIMQKFKDEGIKVINKGGTPKEGSEGITYFKMGLGSVERQVSGIKSPIIQKGLTGLVASSYNQIKMR